MFMRAIKAYTLIEMLIVLLIVMMLTAIAVPNIVRARMDANEAAAESALKSIAAAIETYRTAHLLYPDRYNSLFSQSPPYLTVDYCNGQGHSGYLFHCDDGEGNAAMTTATYLITARPAGNFTGDDCFQVSNGGVLQTRACW